MDFNYSTAAEYLSSGAPDLPLAEMWPTYRSRLPLISPTNRRRYHILVVGTGLAGSSAAATLGELGYQVTVFCLQDSPRRAHSVAAQGGINAATNLANDGDSVERLFRDTIRGGDYRARESNVYRLAQLSSSIIDNCAAQGVPFAREYGGSLAARSFGGTQVARTFYARGQTGQQLLLGAYGSLMRQVQAGRVAIKARREMVDLVVSDHRARGIMVLNHINGSIEFYAGDAVVLASGGYSSVYHLSTNGLASNIGAVLSCYKRGALFANPCFTQIHPTCLPQAYPFQAKLVLMSESLRNDGRIWVPSAVNDGRRPQEIPESERDYFLERMYPAFGNLVPRDVASRAVRTMCGQGFGVGANGQAVYLDLSAAIARQGLGPLEERYGNLFRMYEELTGCDPRRGPLEIFPAPHYTMGGLWVDYDLMTTIPGLFALGEANYSDHGANRLGASALMQGLADGYFIAPATIAAFLARSGPVGCGAAGCGAAGVAVGCGSAVGVACGPVGGGRECGEVVKAAAEAFRSKVAQLRAVRGKQAPMRLSQRLGSILWERVGICREGESLLAAEREISQLEEVFRQDVSVPCAGEGCDAGGGGGSAGGGVAGGGSGSVAGCGASGDCGDGCGAGPDSVLTQARRLADNLEFAHLLTLDAWHRRESCGGHFRTEHQTSSGEGQRDDDNFAYVAAWEYRGPKVTPVLHKEPLSFAAAPPAERNYR